MRYRVLIEQDEDGVFVAEVPSLPGCVSQGSTRKEALSNVREAIAAFVESLEAHGEPVPPPISEEIVHTEPPFRRVTVPNHKEVAKGTLRAVLRHVGLTADDFVKLLD